MKDYRVENSRSLYDAFLEKKESYPIYFLSWWQDAAVGEHAWKAYCLLYKEQVWAVFPLFTPSSRIACLSPYSQMGGILYADCLEKKKENSKVFLHRRRLLNAFLDHLGSQRLYKFAFTSGFSDFLPLHWRSYSSSFRCTYRLPIVSKDELERRMSRRLREKVRAGSKKGWSYSANIAKSDLLSFIRHLYHTQSVPVQFLNPLATLIDASLQREEAFLSGVYDAEGSLLSVAFITYHKGRGYLIANALNPEKSTPEGMAFLLYHSLLDLQARGVKEFDFEGSMLKGVERFFRLMGGEQVAFLEVSKGKLSLWDRMLIRRYYRKRIDS